MTKIIWRLVNVGFEKEATRWTSVSVWTFTPKTELSFQDTAEYIEDESSIGTINATRDSYVSKRMWTGDIGWNVNLNEFGKLLLSTLWQVTSSETTWTGAYEHVFNILQSNQHPSLTIAMSDPVEWDKSFPLSMLSSLTISGEANWFVTYTATFMSKASEGATHTVAYSTDYTIRTGNGWLYIADTLAAISTAESNCIQSFEISFEKNLTEDNCLFSNSPVDFINQNFTVTWSFTADFETTTYQDYNLSWNKKAMRLSFVDNNTTIWVSDNPTLEFDFSKVAFTEFDKSMGNDEIVNQTVTFTAYQWDDDKFVEWKIINTTTTY